MGPKWTISTWLGAGCYSDREEAAVEDGDGVALLHGRKHDKVSRQNSFHPLIPSEAVVRECRTPFIYLHRALIKQFSIYLCLVKKNT